MALPLTSSLEWRSRSSTMEWYVTTFKLWTCNCYIHLDSDTFFTVWLNSSLFSFPYPPLPLHFTDEDGYWEGVEVGQPAGHWHHCYQDHPAVWDQELQVSIDTLPFFLIACCCINFTLSLLFPAAGMQWWLWVRVAVESLWRGRCSETPSPGWTRRRRDPTRVLRYVQTMHCTLPENIVVVSEHCTYKLSNIGLWR